MPINIPNLLTWLRILLIPVFVVFYYLPGDWFDKQTINLAAVTVFIIAAITDWLDGYLARALGQRSSRVRDSAR